VGFFASTPLRARPACPSTPSQPVAPLRFALQKTHKRTPKLNDPAGPPLPVCRRQIWKPPGTWFRALPTPVDASPTPPSRWTRLLSMPTGSLPWCAASRTSRMNSILRKAKPPADLVPRGPMTLPTWKVRTRSHPGPARNAALLMPPSPQGALQLCGRHASELHVCQPTRELRQFVVQNSMTFRLAPWPVVACNQCNLPTGCAKRRKALPRFGKHR